MVGNVPNLLFDLERPIPLREEFGWSSDMEITPFQLDPLPYSQLGWCFVIFDLLELIQSCLQVNACLMEGLDPFLCSWYIIWNEVNVDRGFHSCNQFVGGYFKCVMFPRVVGIFCNWQQLCPTPWSHCAPWSEVLFEPGIHSLCLSISSRVKGR